MKFGKLTEAGQNKNEASLCTLLARDFRLRIDFSPKRKSPETHQLGLAAPHGNKTTTWEPTISKIGQMKVVFKSFKRIQVV